MKFIVISNFMSSRARSDNTTLKAMTTMHIYAIVGRSELT
jgi:hypothetical protein